MKPIALPTLLLLCSLILSGFTDVRLSKRSSAVDPESKVWDFSDGKDADDGPLYRVYGDTLLTEYFDGIRQWYGFRGDTTFYLGEESRLMKVLPQDTVFTAAFGNSSLFGVHAEHGRGMFCRQFPLGTDGIYRTELPVKGSLILSEGDTIEAVAVREMRSYQRWLNSDTLPGMHRELMRTRWFIDGIRLPVALQITEITSDSTNVINSFTVAYTIDSGTLDLQLTQEQIIDRALQNAEITVENGRVSIRGSFPEGTVLMLSVSGLMGNGLIQEELTADETGVYDMTLPSLATGQYIITVSAGTPVSRKTVLNL